MRRELALILAVFGVGSHEPTSLKPARWDTAEGWHDLTIPIDEVSKADSGPISVVAKGGLAGSAVGLRLLIKRDMPPGIRDGRPDTSAFVAMGIVVEPIGDPTERLIDSLANAYSTERPRGRLRKTIPWTTIALEGDPRQIESERVRFKIFHDDNNDRGQYYELFVHVDLLRGEIALNEKDSEYRPAVIRGFVE